MGWAPGVPSPDTGSSQYSESKSGSQGCSEGHRRSPGEKKDTVRDSVKDTGWPPGDAMVTGRDPEVVATMGRQGVPPTVLAFSEPDAWATLRRKA